MAILQGTVGEVWFGWKVEMVMSHGLVEFVLVFSYVVGVLDYNKLSL